MATIRVTGVRELRRQLNQLDKDLAKALKEGLFEIAKEIADKTRPKIPVRTGKAAASLKPRKQSAAAAVAVGGNKAPYYQWIEWGGRVGRNKSVVRPFIPEGRYLYPTLKEERDQVREKFDRIVEDVSRRAGLL